jgi:hypothetical protein
MTKKKAYKSGYIFVTPSFITGMGSVLNIAGNYFPFAQASSPIEADYQAIASDWGVIGHDIQMAADDVTGGRKNSHISR